MTVLPPAKMMHLQATCPEADMYAAPSSEVVARETWN